MVDCRQQTGQAMVEYALTAILVFTMMVFLMDGGRILWNYVSVANAARVCTRYAITHGSAAEAPLGPAGFDIVCGSSPTNALCEQVQTRVPGFTAADLRIVARWPSGNARGNKVVVDVHYTVRPLTSLVWAGQTIVLHSRSTMVIQQ